MGQAAYHLTLRQSRVMTTTAPGLDDALKEIARTFGVNAVMRLGKREPEKVDVISTGSKELNKALGCGGLPRGRVTEMFGPEGVGKTTIALHVLAEAQKLGLSCAFVDTEHELDLDYASALGVDVPEVLLAQPSTAEEALEVMQKLAAGGIGVIVLDSVAALTPLAELEGEAGEAVIGLKARLIGQAMRRIKPLLNEHNTLLLCINQNREKVGVIFGSPIVQPGGKAIKYAAAVRLEVKKGQPAAARKGALGPHKQEVKVKVVKNKCAAPFREAVMWVEYGRGLVDKR